MNESPNDYRVTSINRSGAASPATVGTRGRVGELLATHTVLRNTYLLLAATLLFSAAMAEVAIAVGIQRVNPILMLVGVFGCLFWVQATRNSAWGLLAVFAFTGFFGFVLGPVVEHVVRAVPNGGNVVMTSLGGTGAIFAAMSGYAMVSKRDFSKMGSFLTAGVMVLVVASIANLFLNIGGLSLVISAVAMFVFSGLMIFDTSRIIDGGETNYISAAVKLYLDILNVFMSLLNILSGSSRN